MPARKTPKGSKSSAKKPSKAQAFTSKKGQVKRPHGKATIKKKPGKKIVGKKPQSQKRTSQKKQASPVSNLFWKLRQVLPLIEQTSYFDLSQKAKTALAPFEEPKNGVPAIEAWTFTLHPTVLDAFTFGKQKLNRYIVTIDTRMSSIYSPVEEFLRKQVTNVTSYYSGGWADFLCDLQLDEPSFSDFFDELKTILNNSGIQKIEDDINNVLSVFEVSGTKMICGRTVESFPTPSTVAIEEILKDPLRFETVHRDYRSDEALKLFGNTNEVRSYLRKLKADGIIVCFKMVFDFSFGSARDYVPMILGERREAKITMGRLLSKLKTSPILRGPVEELLEIGNITSTDSAENEVKYFFINSYDFPAARNRWKKAIYDAIEEDVNLYNYPLEGTLNESPVYLSDLPEFLNKVKSYEFGIRDRKLFIGWAHHQLLQQPPKIALPTSCLARHGITLGEPGSGKTSADLVIATEVAKVVTQVMILDASGGVQDKISHLPQNTRDKFRRVSVNPATVKLELKSLSDTKGLSLIETSKKDAPEIFSILMDEIESSSGSPGYQPRKINKMLLVEEAGEVLGQEGKQKENLVRLSQLLDEAYRKGWCIWLSTQHPSSIADNSDMAISILKKLKNRIILAQTTEVDTLVEVFRSEKGFTAEDESSIRSAVGSLDLGNAFCRGVELTATEHYLPLVRMKIRRLDQDTETI